MNWTDSKTIKYLALTFAGGVLLQLVPMLQAHKVDWWALGSQAVATLAGILARMAQPDVNAPPVLGFLNRDNPNTGGNP